MPEKKPGPFEPWCAQHKMHPNECFEQHYSNANAGGAISAEEARDQIAKYHRERQAQNADDQSKTQRGDGSPPLADRGEV